MEAYRRFLRERDSRVRAAVPPTFAAAPVGGSMTGPPAIPTPVAPATAVAAGRARSAAWAAAVVADPRAVYVDTETTGCGASDEVIEVAIVANDGALLFETLLRPRRRIPAAVVAVHGITDAHVAAAPTLPEVLDAVWVALADRMVVVYNAPFDRRLIEQTFRLYGAVPPPATYECAMRRYAEFAAADQARVRGGYRWQKLEQAVRAFGGAPGGHRAAADARACRAVVHGMATHHPAPASQSADA